MLCQCHTEQNDCRTKRQSGLFVDLLNHDGGEETVKQCCRHVQTLIFAAHTL